MFCGNCGTRNPVINKFCRECGTRLPERTHPKLSEDQFGDLRAPEPAAPVDHAKVAVLMDVAFAYHREGKTQEAIATCLEAIALNPESTSAHSLLAVLYEEAGLLDEAVAHLRQVLALNPDSEADRENLARLLGDAAPAAAVPPRSHPRRAALNVPLLAGATAGVIALVVTASLVARALRPPEEIRPPEEAAAAVSYAPPSATGTGAPPAASNTPQPATAARDGFEDWLSAPERPQAAAGPAAPAPGPQRPSPGATRSAEARLPRTRPAPSRTEPLSAPDFGEPIEPLPPPQPSRGQTTPRVVLVPTGRSAPARGRTPETAGPTSREIGADLGPVTITPSGGRPGPGSPEGAGSEPRVVVRTPEPSPRDAERWGMTAVAEGRYEVALGHLRKALEGAGTPGDRARIHQQMAYAHQQLGRTADAQAEYQNAIAEYQKQLNQGSNTEMARAGLRASEEGLRTLGR